MTRNEDLAIEIYTRMVSARIALEDARAIALNTIPPAYLINIRSALDHVAACMLECHNANKTLGGVSDLVNKVVSDYAAERNA